jgi:CRISPR system Cascade subunit CasD
MEFLFFRLYAPLASWGEIAVGERRGSWDRPSKSAVLGLVAAALGIERQERERLAALARGYGFGVRVDAPGVPLRDYHTAQSARESDLRKTRRGDPRPMTRKRELSVKARETILSQRDYYADALYTVALWQRDEPPVPLASICDALRKPCFTLYLGRKSCPPALPLSPEIVTIPERNLVVALAAYRPPEPPGLGYPLAHELNRRHDRAILAWEDDVVPEDSGVTRLLTEPARRDLPGDRLRWHFTVREEQVGFLSAVVP